MKLEMVIRDYWDEEDVIRRAEVTYAGDLINSKDRLIWVISTKSPIEKDAYFKFVVAADNALSAFSLLKEILGRDEYGYNIIWDVTAIGVDHHPDGSRIIVKVY